MIVRMKKLALLLYHRERERFLTSLQELGVVHIDVRAGDEAAGNGLYEDRLRKAEDVLAELTRIGKEHPEPAEPSSIPVQTDAESMDDVISRFEELEEAREEEAETIVNLKKDIHALSPWGDFEPDILKRLASAGVRTRFFLFRERELGQLPTDDLYLYRIALEGDLAHCVLFEHGGRTFEPVVGEEITLPEISVSEAERHIASCEARIAELDERMQDFLRYRESLYRYCGKLREESSFELARESMETAASGTVLYLTGWVPSKNVRQLENFLEKYPVWYELADPTPEDAVPIVMKHPPFFRLFSPITRIFSLPDYFEIDPTPFFAPFFLLFFSMALGDLAYGTIVAVAAFIAYLKVPAKTKPIMLLGVFFGIMTAVSGVFLNSVFGQAIFRFPDSDTGFFTANYGWAWLNPYEGEKGTVYPAMAFSMYLGILQIVMGIVLQGINRVRNNSLVFFLDPIGRILMILGLTVFIVKTDFLGLRSFDLGAIPLGEILSSVSPSVVNTLLGVGVVLLFLFNNPANKIFIRLPLGLWEFYQFITGIMGDVLSYLRLFALGLAGGMLGAAFNGIALMFITDAQGVVNPASPMIVLTIVVLVFGHTINLGLSMLGAFVHSLRLTFVEFYKNLGFKGSLKEYSPFAKSTENLR